MEKKYNNAIFSFSVENTSEKMMEPLWEIIMAYAVSHKLSVGGNFEMVDKDGFSEAENAFMEDEEDDSHRK